ncbi:MAG: alpha/beta hydrolase [Legionella sp.]|uniref:alpha/beta hydrolase n=1 Tax=Legionella sp. TaxID=459 RepID=UPI0039E43524
MNYTNFGYRIKQIIKGEDYHWLFFPGGPGLGSEYLMELCQKLKLPGSISLIDFPKDGTNTYGELNLQHWKEGLVDLVRSLEKPIIVAHSFSGMFTLSVPELEPHLAGVILMNTTTTNTFYPHVSAMQQKHQLPDLVPAASQYHLSPSNEAYKEFWQTYKYYCFTAKELAESEKMLSLFAYNNNSYYFAIENFYTDYQCQWSPKVIPAMTIAGENDFICPPRIFSDDERFQSPNILNKIVANGGHCPWIMYLQRVQECFDDFIKEGGWH